MNLTSIPYPGHIATARAKEKIYSKMSRSHYLRTVPSNFSLWIKLILFFLAFSVDLLETNLPFSRAQETLVTEKGLGTVHTQNGATIFVEIADSPDKRTEGLMFRPSMAPDRGMLFLFPESGDHTFWMKNTLISLDIFWLDESGAILHIEQNVPICTRKDDGCLRYRGPSQSLQVLELNAGMAKKLGLAVGSQLKIDLPPMSFPY